MSVFKVFYQENAKEIPVRENTKVLYIEATDEPEVRAYLNDRGYNVELVQQLSDAYLEFEKQSEDFKLEKANG